MRPPRLTAQTRVRKLNSGCVFPRFRARRTRSLLPMIEPRIEHDAARALAQSLGVVVRDVGGASVLIHLASNRIFELNGPGARVWALVGAGLNREEIVRQLASDYPAAADLEASVDDLLSALEREGLIRGR